MSFNIEAVDKNGVSICSINPYMGAFRMMMEQGYDWFKLIDAEECDGGISGIGETKNIKLNNLKEAFDLLKKFKVTMLSIEGRDEITYRRPILLKFMKDCIIWCEKNNKESIPIDFY